MMTKKILGLDALNTIIGKTIVELHGIEKESDEVKILFSDGSVLNLYHWQECCENVSLYDFELTVKDIDKLIGGVINDARADSSYASDDGECRDDSCTWTFYNINTSKGCINMRWLGQSNGYYGEGVDVELHLK